MSALRPAILVGIALAAIMSVETLRLLGAMETFESRQAGVRSLESDVESIEGLRKKAPQFSWRERPQNDWITLVNRALQDAEIPQGRLESLVPDETGAAGSLRGVRKQSVRCIVKNISLTKLGHFLDAMGRLDGQQVATSIEIVATRDSGPSDGTLRATITFSTLVRTES